jgi:hypothetical protein
MRTRIALLGVLVAAALTTATGCGDKIQIPEPKGLFSVNLYLLEAVYPDDDPRAVTVAQGNIFVTTSERLTKRDQEYGEIAHVAGLSDPRAVTADPQGEVVFLWEQGTARVHAYAAADLTMLHTSALPAGPITGLACNRAGIELVPGARTFLYASDPDSGFVHRLVYDDFAGFSSYGILCRSDGDAARFVHEPMGLTSDVADSLLVCDADTLRNWVIRFHAVPDLDDVAADPDDPDPWRGRAALFDVATCNPPAAADYVLGDAPECDETGWQGGPGSAEAEFHAPRGVAVDGSGRIFVADTGNHRIQIFTPDGYFDFLFGRQDISPGPTSLAVTDFRYGGGADDVNWGAYIFVVHPAEAEVRKFISSEQYIYVNQEPPPPQ